MPASRVKEEDVLAKIAEVFRRQGYEGASVRMLAKAAGLEPASLYSRFPGGKEEMALQVVARVCQWFGANVFEPLHAGGSSAEILRRIVPRLRKFYQSGELWCVLDTLTLGDSTPAVRAAALGAYRAWLAEFEWAARHAGIPAKEATARARQALMEIEGSLVIARVTGDNQLFLGVLKKLPELLTKR
jgi:TetR/AcrR family transcriptional repressor of lmrAB and yxaGH operons